MLFLEVVRTRTFHLAFRSIRVHCFLRPITVRLVSTKGTLLLCELNILIVWSNLLLCLSELRTISKSTRWHQTTLHSCQLITFMNCWVQRVVLCAGGFFLNCVDLEQVLSTALLIRVRSLGIVVLLKDCRHILYDSMSFWFLLRSLHVF